LHRSSNRESLQVIAARTPGGDLLGSTLQLCIGLHDTSWVSPGAKWSARFSLQVMHQASRIQLIHWFDSFPEPSGDVRSWSGKVVAREVTLPCVERWDVDRHADQSGNIG